MEHRSDHSTSRVDGFSIRLRYLQMKQLTDEADAMKQLGVSSGCSMRSSVGEEECV